MSQYQSESYIRAKKKVDRMKGFYKHLSIYIVANILLFFLKIYFFGLISIDELANHDFEVWLDWNIVSTPIIWGVFLVIHGIVAHKHMFTFLNKWEERQIQKYMEEDEDKRQKYK